MASELEPLAHDWCEGFVCPLRVVGREGGVLRPDLRYPRAESLSLQGYGPLFGLAKVGGCAIDIA